MLSGDVARRGADCAYRVIDREALIVKVSGDEGGRVFTLNKTGTVVWELADGTRTLDDIAAEIEARFDAARQPSVSDDIREFVADLERLGIMSRASQLEEEQIRR